MGARSRAGWLVLLAAGGLIAVVALTSRSGLSVAGLAAPDARALLTIVDVMGYVVLGVGLVVLPVVIVQSWRRSRARRRADGRAELQPLPLWARLLAMAILSAFVLGELAILPMLFDQIGQIPIELAPPDAGGAGSQDPGGLAAAGTDTTALIIAGVILATLSVLAVAVALRWRAVDRPNPPAAADHRRAATEALEISLEALRREPDPRRAVIAAYAAMERSLSKAGFGRSPSEAPLEYLRRVLDVSGLADEHLRTITVLFQHARFSDHPVRESMRTEAVDALGRVRLMIGGHA